MLYFVWPEWKAGKEPENMAEKIHTRQQAADALAIGLSTLDKLMARKDNPLPHIRVGRRVLIPADKLDEWISEEQERQTEVT